MTLSVTEKELATMADGLTQAERAQLALLIETPEGAVVLDREFGLDYACLDNPPAMAQNLLAASLAPKISRYIPSLRLVAVKLLAVGQDGGVSMKVVVDHV